MSAYSTRTVTKEEAIKILMEYKAEEYKQQLQFYYRHQLEEVLNYFAEDYPYLYLLTNWRVTDKEEN